ncbi:MAG: MipA/OmpV family protein [Aliihoeflea sp.]
MSVSRNSFAAAVITIAALAASSAHAFDQPQYGYQEPSRSQGWFSGDWYLKVGGAVLHAPRFEGAARNQFAFQPMISFGRHGNAARFTSRNDNISVGILDNGVFRAGVAGKFIWGRDASTHNDLRGLAPVRFGGELGGFVDVYPTDFVRLRGELRRGIRSHDGVVADFAADAFLDFSDTIRISGGPRASWASKGYFDAYYGVNAAQSAASGLNTYSPSSGFRSFGAGGAITWQATDTIETSVFAEYSRLVGPAAQSSLVRQRGSRDQFTVGTSATYRFDFSLP